MSKSAYQKNRELYDRLLRLSDKVTLDDCAALRRAALTLSHWCELECGNSNDWASWAIERDEVTEKPYFVRHSYRPTAKTTRNLIPDREKGALKRIKTICDRLGLHFYYQTDPRGWPLYVDKEPLPDNNYVRGIGIGE